VSGIFPAQQGFAAGNGVGLQVHQWLIVDLEVSFVEAAGGYDLPQIPVGSLNPAEAPLIGAEILFRQPELTPSAAPIVSSNPRWMRS